MKLYLSGSITKDPHYRRKFARAARIAREYGYEVENPAESIGLHAGWKWLDYMKEAVRLMMACDGVALLPGWLRSRGARIEALLAWLIGMPVRTAENWKGSL